MAEAEEEDDHHEEEEEYEEDDATLEAVVSAWELIDFRHLQDSIAQQVEHLVGLEEARREQRKDIAARTREFRALPTEPSSIKESALDLIKVYQQAYETVSTEAKFGSQAMLTTYKMLRHLPDPAAPQVKLTMGRLLELEQRNILLESREDSLATALRAAREKNRGLDELTREREGFQSKIQFDGQALVESERLKNQEELTRHTQRFEEDTARLHAQLEDAGEEMERVRAANVELEQRLASSSSQPLRKPEELHHQLEAARTEGFATAQQQFLGKITALTEDNEKVSRKFLSQIDLLQSHLAESMEHISQLKLDLATRPTQHEFDALKNQLAVISRVQDGNSSSVGVEDQDAAAPEYLDGLSSFLLATNQRLVAELQQAKADLASAASESTPSDAPQVTVESNSNNNNDDVTVNSAALKAQRDRLRAKLEKRDLEIEHFTNKLEAQESAYRRLSDDTDKLRQRLRFLQSYKVGERSTLLNGGGGDAEDPQQPVRPSGGVLGLGQGVGHQFRTLYGGQANDGVLSRLTQRQKTAVLVLGVYLVVVHAWWGISLYKSFY